MRVKPTSLLASRISLDVYKRQTAHYNGKIARNPFAQYKVDPDHKERGFLTEDELQALTAVELNNPDLELARDLWTFQFRQYIRRDTVNQPL